MFQKLLANDEALNKEPFIKNEVQYNLIHRISESKDSLSLKSSDGRAILVQTPGFNPWLWVSEEVEGDEREKLIRHFAEQLEEHFVPGISGDPILAEAFARDYVTVNKQKSYHTAMVMEAYYCPFLRRPIGVEGAVQPAMPSHIPIIAEFLAGFYKDALGDAVGPDTQTKASERIVSDGSCLLWTIHDEPVSMAVISHRSPRHGRINSVYTPLNLRKKGYASALVADICERLAAEGFLPMLYADVKNPASNKIYKNLGFKESGRIADIRFQ